MSSTLTDPPTGSAEQQGQESQGKQAAENSMSDLFTIAPAIPSEQPAWLKKSQETAWKEFESLPMPSSNNEAWRFASLRKMGLEEFSATQKPSAQAIEKCLTESKKTFRERVSNFVFANGELIYPPELPETFEHAGIICCPLKEAIEKHPDLVSKHLHSQAATLGGEKFSALHRAQSNYGLFLYIPEEVVMETPIELTHWICNDDAEQKNSIFPHCLIIAEKLAFVQVYERFLSADEHAGMSCGAVNLHASEGAKIRYSALQNLNHQSRSYQLHSNIAERSADIRNCQINLGGGWSRAEGNARLNGKSANIDMLCVNVAEGSQEFDHRTFQHHASPHCTSDLLYKNCLFDQSKSVFAGLISVDEDAHFTDAYQTCRNLLMSDEAEANSMPGLEINADQVKCSHGSTSSRIEEEELFYLRARGLTRSQARKLILLGYCMDVVERIEDEALIAELNGLLEAKFAALNA